MKYVLIVFFAILVASYSSPRAQGGDPEWVDLRVDSIRFAYPTPDAIQITGYWSIFNNLHRDTVLAGDLDIELDGIVQWSEPTDVTRSLSNCHVFQTPAECKGECYFNTVPPIEIGECTWFYTDPWDTVPEACVCWKEFNKSWIIPYAGQEMATFRLDPGGVVDEAREWNNVISVHVASVATKPRTWGKIKDTYKND